MKNNPKMKLIVFMLITLIASFTLAACTVTTASIQNDVETETSQQTAVDTFSVNNTVQSSKKTTSVEPTGEYNKGVVLVKSDDFSTDKLGTLDFTSAKPLYKGSSWHEVKLADENKTEEAVKYLADLKTFDLVDYDYVMEGDGEIHSVDISANTSCTPTTVASFDAMGIRDAWDYFVKNEKHPGGSPDVIVAVIDTGVDYNHVDLRRNIWTNSAEIPDNGIDDDNNGYIDDVYGWDFVGNDKDPMDDNGHGTHCAGIVAADNNAFGVVGVAYNCKVMCLKAGSSSGYFNNSDIAEAVRYAYMNGASVISMSFGGTSISMAVEEALEDAYNQCVLVAAAGNDGMCNQPGCPYHKPFVEVCYPAALTYVIGVMSCNADGTYQSSFSNFDHYQYNTYEYDVFAPGEQIASTFPNNKYASLSGTSMATPNVAGIAALLRSEFSDRETYSSKFITSQIVANGGKEINGYYVANAYNAINNIPKPNIYGIYDYYIFDNEEFSANNNGNGIIEAGETIHLGFELMNRGGKATDVTVSVNTKRLADDITDPYIHILSNDITYAEIGTYSIRDGGKIYDENDNVIGVQNPIVIKIDENTPNDYLSVINFVVTYKNGLDSKDTTEYKGEGAVSLTVTNGYLLPDIIMESITYSNTKRYLVNGTVTIPRGVTVTFEPGCIIEFYVKSSQYFDDTYNTPGFDVYGQLNCIGEENNYITLTVSELFTTYFFDIHARNTNNVVLKYCNIINLFDKSNGYGGWCNISNSNYSIASENMNYPSFIEDGVVKGKMQLGRLSFDSCNINLANMRCAEIIKLENSLIKFSCQNLQLRINTSIQNDVFLISPSGSGGEIEFINCDKIKNNAFLFTDQPKSITNVPKIKFYDSSLGSSIDFYNRTEQARERYAFKDNYFDLYYRTYSNKLFENNITPSGNLILDPNDYENHDGSVIWPYIKNIELFNKDGEKIRTVGSEKVTAKVTFNRAMDTSKEFKLYYGSVAPYTDYVINGNFAEDGLTWMGEFQVKATIEGGTNFFSAGDSCAADDSFKTLINNAPAFTFDINTASALSMTMFAEEKDNGIELSWIQDDYDTLMGYNVYRSNEKDGNYVKLNTSVIPVGENTFLDENAEPGKTYWYTFTVVLSDMSESKPAGKISATAKDTIAPRAYHTPVNQGYLNNNLVISCTASDNVSINNAKLYYRTKGETAWKVLTMLKQNDKYSATVFGSELSLEGLEYYIVVSDGINEITKGTSENPYTVIIKDASAISRLGDVDGDGVVTTKDALMLMQCINGDLILTDDEFKRADLNKDNVLSSVEALRILQYINGNVATLEM